MVPVNELKRLLLTIYPMNHLLHGKCYSMVVNLIQFYLSSCSVQFSHRVMSDSSQSYGLQHTRPPCPSPTTWVYSNSCPSSRWCHPTISSSVIPFSSSHQSMKRQKDMTVELLILKKEQICAIYRVMDGPRDCHSEWSQRKTNIIY